MRFDYEPLQFSPATRFCTSSVQNVSQTYLRQRPDDREKSITCSGLSSRARYHPHILSQTGSRLNKRQYRYSNIEMARLPTSSQ